MTDVELAKHHYWVAYRETPGDDKHTSGVAAVWALARACAFEDAARQVRDGGMCPGCGHRDQPDPRGEAAEPKATPQIVCNGPAIESLTPAPVEPAAGTTAGGMAITDETVERFWTTAGASGLTLRHVHGGGVTEAIRAGLSAAAPLIVEQYLRTRAGTVGVVAPDGSATDPAVNAFFDAYGWGNFEAVRAGLTGWPREAAAIRAGLDAASLAGADQRSEVEILATELLIERELIEQALPVLRYVSAGRRYVDVEPYPDAAARALLGELEREADQ